MSLTQLMLPAVLTNPMGSQLSPRNAFVNDPIVQKRAQKNCINNKDPSMSYYVTFI